MNIGDEYFKHSDSLVIHFEADRRFEPVTSRLKASVQGQILFIGDYWLTVAEARALRDWLSSVLPE